jgi:hypothetical protein
MTTRKHLSGEALYRTVASVFSKIPEHRREKSVVISLKDALMSGLAIFALKYPSLLQYDDDRAKRPEKLKGPLGIEQAPSDTQMREILDGVEPDSIRPAYKRVLFEIQRGKDLEAFAFYQSHYLIAVDGTQPFSSDTVHCEDCLVKTSKDGKTTYSHQMLAAAIVHPDQSVVIPLCPEPIKKQDGQTKNDCERSAGKRFVEKFREDHPKMKAIFVEDALSANVPRIRDLRANDIRFILGAKPGNCRKLFEQVEKLDAQGLMNRFASEEEIGQKVKKKVSRRFRYLNGIKLNDANDERVNFFEVWETTEWLGAKGVEQKEESHFSWITDLDIYKENLLILTKGGRARWRIENETFNTLKNQGYEFEHNFGHGYKHLSSCFALLMMLAFLIDQTQQLCCGLFQAALAANFGKRTRLWQRLRWCYDAFVFTSWTRLLEAAAYMGTFTHTPPDTC